MNKVVVGILAFLIMYGLFGSWIEKKILERVKDFEDLKEDEKATSIFLKPSQNTESDDKLVAQFVQDTGNKDMASFIKKQLVEKISDKSKLDYEIYGLPLHQHIDYLSSGLAGFIQRSEQKNLTRNFIRSIS